jgi:hypothetical protein
VDHAGLIEDALCRLEDCFPARAFVDDVFSDGSLRWGFRVVGAAGHTAGSSLLLHTPPGSLLTGKRGCSRPGPRERSCAAAGSTIEEAVNRLTVTTLLFIVSLIAVAIAGTLTELPGLELVVLGMALIFAVMVLTQPARGSGSTPSDRPAKPPPAPEPEPEQDSAYELLEVVGTGQMGTVHKARHRRLGRAVAIKTIKPGNVNHEDTARFEREARVIAGLYSPHTVSIHDFGTRSDGSLYYVMELLSGIDLQAFIERHGPMAPERAIYVLRQICHSLEEAHSSGLVHRDLKPSNIMLCKYGLDADFVKVVDFGLVKGGNLASESVGPLTKEHTVLGTPAYLAPESVKGSRQVLPSADVYALGCIAFWLLTARLVFDYQQLSQMVAAHVGETPSPPSRHVPTGVPPELDTLVLSCLEKQPERRPSAGELVRQLERMQLGRAWTSDDARRWWRRRES